MYIENLHLEVTRNCTLECEHCLRGESQKVNMSPKVLDTVFDNVTQVDFLLLTGGEPLLAIQTLERLAEILKQKKVKVNKIIIVSNGTVCSERVLNVLKELASCSYFMFKVSNNIFHNLELNRLNLTSIRDRNLDLFKNSEIIWNFDDSYGKENEGICKASILRLGKAKEISPERLAEINTISTEEYIIVNPDTPRQPETTIEDDKVLGYITVDVYGDIVTYGQEFAEEDKEAYETGLNILEIPFDEAVRLFIERKTEERKITPFKSGIFEYADAEFAKKKLTGSK